MATQLAVGAFDKVLASTLAGIVPGMGMNVYNATPVFDAIMKKGNKKPWEGESQRVKLIGKTYKSTTRYTDYDTGDTTAQEPFTVADYEMSGYMQFVTLANMQIRKNSSSPKKLFDIVETEAKLAMQAMRNDMNIDLLSSTNVAKAVLSLDTITDATTTIAGVAGSSTWGGTTTASGSWAAQGKNDLMTITQVLSQYVSLDGKGGTDKPDLLLTTQAVQRFYWNSLESARRYTASDKGDSYMEVRWDGIPLVTDPQVTTGRMYVLNTSHLYVWVHGDADFSVKPDVRPLNADSSSKMIVWNGQIGTDARRYEGKLTGIVA